jgi:hypothetical protein
MVEVYSTPVALTAMHLKRFVREGFFGNVFRLFFTQIDCFLEKKRRKYPA